MWGISHCLWYFLDGFFFNFFFSTSWSIRWLESWWTSSFIPEDLNVWWKDLEICAHVNAGLATLLILVQFNNLTTHIFSFVTSVLLKFFHVIVWCEFINYYSLYCLLYYLVRDRRNSLNVIFCSMIGFKYKEKMENRSELPAIKRVVSGKPLDEIKWRKIRYYKTESRSHFVFLGSNDKREEI